MHMPDNYKYRDETWLREKYESDMYLREIADECGVNKSTIVRWLDKHGIELNRTVGQRVQDGDTYSNEEWLKEKYYGEKLSTKQIADLCDTSKETIRRWIGRHGMEKRSHSEACQLSWEDAEERREHLRKLREKDETNTQFYHTARWKNLRIDVLKRDGYVCQECGTFAVNSQVHHITPVSDGGAKFELDNLVTLCRNCHADKHHGNGLILASNDP